MPVPRPDPRTVAGGVAFLALAVVVLYTAVEVLPDGAIVGVVTPVRAVLGVGLVALLVARPTGWPDRAETGLLVAVAALLAASALATAVSGAEWSVWRGHVTGAAVLVLAAGVRRTMTDVREAVGLLALVAVGIAGAVAVRQIAVGARTGFCRGPLDGGAGACGPGSVVRAIGTFDNPNVLAAYLVLVLPLATAAAAAAGGRPSRLVGWLVVALGSGAVLLTGSRTGVLAVAVAVAAFLLLRRPTPRRFLVAAGIGVVLLAATVAVSGGHLGVRVDVWGAAVRALAGHPLGAGPGRAGPLLNAAIPGPEPFQHAHDLWLNWAVEAGWPGLAAALAVTACAARLVLRLRDSVPGAALGAGLAAFAAVSVVDDPANAQRIALIVGVALGLLFAPIRPRPGQEPVAPVTDAIAPVSPIG